MKQAKKYRIMWIILSVIAALACIIILFINQPDFGKTPRGERLERVRNSPNYRNGKFQNLHETQQITSEKGLIFSLFDFLFKKKERLTPKSDLPSIKTDLWKLAKDDDLLIWFGHSSYFIQTDKKRILVDPVLNKAASPVSFVNKAFKGTDVYRPEDIPDIDYLIITHDHWDHLDYITVKALKDRIGKVICGLGVGEHFEYWGFDKESIIELDWNDKTILANEFTIFGLPARHFSGRGLSLNQSLWCSYLIQTPSRKIYIGGDGGYDTHCSDIGKQFGEIDLAILENGQYDTDWKYIHFLPEQIVEAFNDLNAKKLFTVHHSKFALANHAWDEPLRKISEAAEKNSIPLLTPIIGEVVNLNDSVCANNKWWEQVDIMQ